MTRLEKFQQGRRSKAKRAQAKAKAKPAAVRQPKPKDAYRCPESLYASAKLHWAEACRHVPPGLPEQIVPRIVAIAVAMAAAASYDRPCPDDVKLNLWNKGKVDAAKAVTQAVSELRKEVVGADTVSAAGLIFDRLEGIVGAR